MDPDVYVVIRGSAEPWDFDTLLDMDGLVTRVGVVHTGFYKAAEFVLERARTFINQCQGTVYFTGHSYGGSVSSIATLLLNMRFPGRAARAITFGSVPSMDDYLRREAQRTIASFVADTDVIPTLSSPNMLTKLRENMTISATTPVSDIENALYKIWSGYNITGVAPGQLMVDGLQRATPRYARHILAHAVNGSESVRYVAGDVYHISTTKEMTLSEARVDATREFAVLETDEWAVGAHVPTTYKDALELIQ